MAVFKNLAVWSQTEHLNLMVAPRSVLRHYKHCKRAYQGVLPSSRLRYFIKAVSSQIYQKCNWWRASDELAICTARVERCRAGPRALLHALHHYPLRVKIILVDFIFGGFNPDRQTAKFKSPSNFLAIWYIPTVLVYIDIYSTLPLFLWQQVGIIFLILTGSCRFCRFWNICPRSCKNDVSYKLPCLQ